MRALLVILILLTSVKAHAITIVDGLNGLNTGNDVSVFGTGGYPVNPDQLIGPRFTLSEPTRITEVGGFIDVGGQGSPLEVQIRTQINGLPGSLIASFPLSNDNQVTLLHFESASPNLALAAGTYYALLRLTPTMGIYYPPRSRGHTSRVSCRLGM